MQIPPEGGTTNNRARVSVTWSVTCQEHGRLQQLHEVTYSGRMPGADREWVVPPSGGRFGGIRIVVPIVQIPPEGGTTNNKSPDLLMYSAICQEHGGLQQTTSASYTVFLPTDQMP